MSAKEPELLFSSDDDDPMDEVVKKNTMANSLSKFINHDKPVEDETNLENSENSDNSEPSESDSEGTHDDSTASIASIDADLSDADADADADAGAVSSAWTGEAIVLRQMVNTNPRESKRVFPKFNARAIKQSCDTAVGEEYFG